MTLDQGLAFAIVIGMMALFVWGRFRYDLVALLALLAAIAAGIVPTEGGLLRLQRRHRHHRRLRAARQRRRGAIRRGRARGAALGPYLTSTTQQIVVLAGSVALLSAFVKNIGALAMLMPVAFQFARRDHTSPSSLLMPMAFGSLLGGTITLIGTSPNIIVSRMRERSSASRSDVRLHAGRRGLALIGIVFLAFGYRLLPRARKGAGSIDAAFNLEAYATEVEVPEDSPFAGKTIADIEKQSGRRGRGLAVIRERRRFEPAGKWQIKAGDILILHGEPEALERHRQRREAGARPPRQGASRSKAPSRRDRRDGGGVTPTRRSIGRSAGQLAVRPLRRQSARRQPHAASASRSRLRSIKLKAGDVIVLQGN